MELPNNSEHPMHYFPKELSWLAFNERVLQEAADERNPLIERLRFLGIYSNNMDEFYRVRVADVKRRIMLQMYHNEDASQTEHLLKQIQQFVLRLGAKFNAIHMDLQLGLRKHNIEFIDQHKLNESQSAWVKSYFKEKVLRHISPILLSNEHLQLSKRLEDNATYLMVEMTGQGKPEYAIVQVPTDDVSRFLELPIALNRTKRRGRYRHQFMMLDDVIIHCLRDLFVGFFDFCDIQAYSMKLTKDAEYDLSESLDQSLLDKMSHGIRQRLESEPVRLVYDVSMPEHMLKILRKLLGANTLDALIPGGRYRNFKDFINFPYTGHASLEFSPLPPLPSPDFEQHNTTFDAIRSNDVLLHYPYHNFTYFTEWVRQASFDPRVKSIKMTMYRVAKNSRVIHSLLDAVRNGKKVTVVVELKARFDEAKNVEWARKLEEAGCHVAYGLVGLKTHCKMSLAIRQEEEGLRAYYHVGTGNYNAKTSATYTDLGLLSCNPELGADLMDLFNYLTGYSYQVDYRRLLVAPVNMRQRFLELIEQEIQHALAGRCGRIVAKMNGLEDSTIVRKLYEASQAGVMIDLIVRGNCRLRPGLAGVSDNIRVLSIIGRYLEHARIYYFANAGEPLCYIGSADWMRRNLSSRVEAAALIEDPRLQEYLSMILQNSLDDHRHGWELQPDGRYRQRQPSVGCNALEAGGIQNYLMQHTRMTSVQAG